MTEVPERFVALATEAAADILVWEPERERLPRAMLAPVLEDLLRQVDHELERAKTQRLVNGDRDGDDERRLAYYMWTAEMNAWSIMRLMLDGYDVDEGGR